MPKSLDLTGHKYGFLTVLSYHSRNKHGQKIWLCECDCGKKAIKLGMSLRKGLTKSCGCYIKVQSRKNIKKANEHNTKHGMAVNGKKNRFYLAWENMKARCLKPSSRHFNLYGGRGITVCERWMKFENFKEDMLDSYEYHCFMHSEEETSLERLNVNGNYDPGNCTWATRSQQGKNRQETKRYEYKGNLYTLYELGELSGIKPDTLYSRIIRRHWTVERAVETTINKKMRNRYAKGSKQHEINQL